MAEYTSMSVLASAHVQKRNSCHSVKFFILQSQIHMSLSKSIVYDDFQCL